MNHYLNRPLLMDARFVAPFLKDPKVAASLFGEREECESELEERAIRTIRVVGSLWHRGWWNTYERIERQFNEAMEDNSCKGIVFDMASPGGEVSGTFDLSDLIYESRGEKPTLAVVNEMSASACYALASACDEIVVPRTGTVGSVGVLVIHWDDSKMLDEAGMKPTLIFQGDHKVDGNSFQTLPEDVRADIQADIGKTYDLFVETVARNRGMTTAQVIETQARMFTGGDAVSASFADIVLPAREALANFKTKLTARTGGSEMKIKIGELKTKLTAVGLDDEKIAALKLPEGDEEEVEMDEALLGQLTGLSSKAEESETPKDEEMTEGQRIQAITQSEHAEGRKALAEQLAFETTLSASVAIATLEKAPKAVVATDNSEAVGEVFTKMIKQFGTQDIDSDLPGGGGENGQQTDAQKTIAAMSAAHQKATGISPVKT